MEIGAHAMYFFVCHLLSDKVKHKPAFQNGDGEKEIELSRGVYEFYYVYSAKFSTN